MSKIKCIENYKELREMFLKGEKGNAEYFAAKLNISIRSFYRLVKYLKEIESIDIRFDKHTGIYFRNLPPPFRMSINYPLTPCVTVMHYLYSMTIRKLFNP